MHSSLAIHPIVLVLPGVVFGAGNTAATLAGFISVPATGYLLQVRGQGLNVGRAERTGGMAGAGVEAAISLGASEEGRRYLLPNVQELAQLWLGGGGRRGEWVTGLSPEVPLSAGYRATYPEPHSPSSSDDQQLAPCVRHHGGALPSGGRLLGAVGWRPATARGRSGHGAAAEQALGVE